MAEEVLRIGTGSWLRGCLPQSEAQRKSAEPENKVLKKAVIALKQLMDR